MTLKHSDLKAAVADYTGLQVIEPCDKAWGATFDLVAVDEGKLFGYLLVDQEEIATHIALWVDPIIERMTNTWVLVTPDLVHLVAHDCPLNAGLAVVIGWDDVRVIRPPTVLRPALHYWVAVLTEAERLELVPGCQEVSDPLQVAEAAIELHGDFLSREAITKIMSKRLPPAPIQWDSLSPLDLLNAAQKRLEGFKPALM